VKKAGQVSSYLISGAGIFGFAGGSAYVSSKFAEEGLSESISYDLELFGIKVILEHVFIKTNFGQAMVIAKKLTPYSRMIQKVAANLSSKADNGASAELVAKVILEAVTSKEPNLRYLAGKDVEILAANKRTMSDTEFRNMIGKMA
jgi:NAD(P)-dependent dehydrogenase (short-subunit alcohol dehydrogenase family)